MPILFSATDAVSCSSWPILYKVLMLSVTMSTVHFGQSHFSWVLGLSSIADFSNTGVRAPTSAEHTHSFSPWMAKWFGYMVWIKVMVIFWWLYFFLINRCHFYRWIAVVSWLSHLILAIDLWGSFTQHQVKQAIGLILGSSTLLHIPHASLHSFWSFMCVFKKLKF